METPALPYPMSVEVPTGHLDKFLLLFRPITEV